MYKVMLVDDEYLTRDAISRNTPWGDAGFELVGTAENGKEAIQVLEEKLPDLILTDICMPVMDGIELAAYVHEHHPDIRVIIISGYDDFDYAKRAMKYEVSDYILKPITSFELVEVLEKIARKLDESQEKQNQVDKIRHEYEKNIPMLREHFLNRLLSGTYLKNDIAEQFEHFGIQLRGDFQSVVLVECEDDRRFRESFSDVTDDLIAFSIANISGEITAAEPDVLFLQSTDNGSVCIFSGISEREINRRVEEVGQRIVDALFGYLKIKACIMIGLTVPGPENWSESYQCAQNAREHKFLLDEHVFVYGKEFMVRKEGTPIQTAPWLEKLQLQIKLNQRLELKESVNAMFRSFRESGNEKKIILLHVQNLVLSIMIGLEDGTTDPAQTEADTDFIHHLGDYRHLANVEERFLEFCFKLADDIAGKRENSNQKLAVLAVDYIEKNYSNVNMSLNMVCSHLCVSTSYFSTIFKNATGETFVETLTRVRMEKAKQLLETSNMKSYEVALQVGYNDPHYFSSIFKKHMGMTPTEYAKTLRK